MIARTPAGDYDAEAFLSHRALMNGMYDIRFDIARRVFVITTEGFWSLGTLASFSAATVAQGMAMRVRHGFMRF